MIRGVRVPPNLVEQIVPLYQSGKKGREIAALLGISDRSVFNYLQRFNVERRALGTRHTLRHDAFSLINAASAYWAGFLFADGHIDWSGHRQSPSICLKIAKEDESHITKFRNFLGSSHSICHSKVNGPNRQNMVGLTVSSAQLAYDLKYRGMAEYSLDRFPSKDMRCLRDFWRGAIDGDGSLYWYLRKRSKGDVVEPRIHFVGGRRIVEMFKDYVRTIVPEFNGAPKPYRVKGSTWWSITIATHQAVRVSRVLYYKAPTEISLDRKRVLAWEFSLWDGIQLKTHCKHGHLLEGANVRIRARSNARDCRVCARRRIEEFVQRKKAAPAAA